MRKLSNYVFIAVLMFSILCTFAVSNAAELKLSPINVAGDTLYLPETGSFAVGVSTTIATIDVVEIRGILASTVDKVDRNIMGVGIGVNIPKVIAKFGGNWLLDNLNSSIGVTGVTNVDGKIELEPAVYLTVIEYRN